MSRVWRAVVTIVLIAILFATVCVGVGLLTGADFSRVYSVFNSKYNVEMYYNWLTVDVYQWFLSLF
ncbi:MAG: hypothetical protein IJJ22_04120 [Oscillospiraceae bacterium]|nr:hypothetical protein [Oscillospiraceae bacterium]